MTRHRQGEDLRRAGSTPTYKPAPGSTPFPALLGRTSSRRPAAPAGPGGRRAAPRLRPASPGRVCRHPRHGARGDGAQHRLRATPSSRRRRTRRSRSSSTTRTRASRTTSRSRTRRARRVFKGDIITGVAKTTYNVPALAAGHLHVRLHGPPEHDRHAQGGGLTRWPRPPFPRPAVAPRRRVVFGLFDAERLELGVRQGPLLVRRDHHHARATSRTGRTTSRSRRRWTSASSSGRRSTSARPRTRPCPARRPWARRCPGSPVPTEVPLPAARTDGAAALIGPDLPVRRRLRRHGAPADVYVSHVVGTGNLDTWSEGPSLPEARSRRGRRRRRQHDVRDRRLRARRASRPTPSTASPSPTTARSGDVEDRGRARPAGAPCRRDRRARLGRASSSWAARTARRPRTASGRASRTRRASPGKWTAAVAAVRGERRRRRDARRRLSSTSWAARNAEGQVGRHRPAGPGRRAERHDRGPERDHQRCGASAPQTNLPGPARTCPGSPPTATSTCRAAPTAPRRAPRRCGRSPDADGRDRQWQHLPQTDLGEGIAGRRRASLRARTAFLFGGDDRERPDGRRRARERAPQPPFFQLGSWG